MIARCLIEPAGREDDRSSVLSAELLRDADSCAVSFEVDIYERDIRSLTSRQLERFARRVRRPEYGKSCVFEYRRRTAGDDCFIFDDQYDHHTVRFFLTPLRITSDQRRRGFQPRRRVRKLPAQLRLRRERARQNLLAYLRRQQDSSRNVARLTRVAGCGQRPDRYRILGAGLQ